MKHTMTRILLPRISPDESGQIMIVEPGYDIVYITDPIPSDLIVLGSCEICGESMMDVTAIDDEAPRYLCPNDHEVRARWCDLCREHHVDLCPWTEIERKYEGVG